MAAIHCLEELNDLKQGLCILSAGNPVIQGITCFTVTLFLLGEELHTLLTDASFTFPG